MTNIIDYELTATDCYINDSGILYLNSRITTDCNLIIPDKINGRTVKFLDNNLFYNNLHIFSIKLPQNVEFIKMNTFEGCKNLKSICLSNNIRSIEEGAFWKCESLEAIKLPDSLTYLGEGAFNSCKNIKEIILPKNLDIINAHVFANCSSLEKIIIPNGIKKIDVAAFDSCKSLKTIVLPESIEEIDSHSFMYCKNLEIIYKGTEMQLNSVLSRDNFLEEDLKWENIVIYATKEIDEYFEDMNYIRDDMYISSIIETPAQQKYVFNKLDNIIRNSSDLNERLRLLTIRDNIEKQNVIVKDKEFEK